MNTFFDEITNAAQAYWLGFITADGNASRDGRTLQINLSLVDADHLDKFTPFVGKEVQRKPNYEYPTCFISVSDKHMWQSLVKKGVVPNKTVFDQSVIFSFVPDNLKSHFIRGLFDGDGCVWRSESGRNPYFAISGEQNLLLVIKKYMCENLHLSDVKIYRGENYGKLKWNGRKQLRVIHNFIYSDGVFLERKKKIFDEIVDLKTSAAPFTGVTWHSAKQKWNAYIWIESKRKHLGYFNDKQAAIDARINALSLSGIVSYKARA